MRWRRKRADEWRWCFALRPLSVEDKMVWLEWVQWRHSQPTSNRPYEFRFPAPKPPREPWIKIDIST